MSAVRVPAAALGVLALLGALFGAWWVSRARIPADPPLGPNAAAPAAAEPTSGSGPAHRSQGARTLEAHAAFVDEAVCAACHADQAAAWSTSHHALAMQPATDSSVLGDFDQARFEDVSGVSSFFRERGREAGPEADSQSAAHSGNAADSRHGSDSPWPDSGHRVETSEPDGRPHVYSVPYVFGVDPLQQLLLALPDGRLQAFSVAWGTKARRWYSLYPEERIGARDPLHWTRSALNWNFSCAECHATDLKRGYDAEKARYRTTWHRLDVGCQACHGPAQKHLAWVTGDEEDSPGRGFQAPIEGSAGEGSAGEGSSRAEVEACARCHSRRAPLADGFDHRHRLMDDYQPALLSEQLYFADGQIQDEVYEYGSFLQSRMHARGVRCSDCHEPHAATLRRPGNLLCTACHSATPELPTHVDGKDLVRKAYDSPTHTLHAPGTPGSFCVDCHMPTRTYMGVDARRDHSLRIPRPDVSARIGAPDACTGCHRERDNAWAAEEIARRFPNDKRPEPFGLALHAGRRGLAGAAVGLRELAGREDIPPIVRASALELLVRYPGRRALEAFRDALEDPDPLVRHAALGGLEWLTPPERVPLVTPMLRDEVRAVRMEAARLLLDQREGADAAERGAAEAEYEAAQRTLLDRPEARLNLAQLLALRGDADGAEAELRAAIGLEPTYVPAAVNLADHLRAKSEPEAEAALRSALDLLPAASAEAAPVEHALGLALVRQGRRPEALDLLDRATRHAPLEPRFGYVLAIALADADRKPEARTELERVCRTSPWFRDAHLALADFHRSAGDAQAMQRALDMLAAINPDDPALGP